ncbi:hypothetical protein FVEN_g12185 [Fusarium venenatum]|uniref:Uncharacterized protein n=1 Tax=Fusarium venenatum TaxID=56646 RepID=A0A2L2TI39_9HYPO|nr:uncharacterized protein FVRRES_09736 [Fusarium venenatum]KAG8349644.1 hypothetical protein FVEN_g12185 [Fusarium venenatum]CEI69659.1 unnamed protein product [Fusarium venenatum]
MSGTPQKLWPGATQSPAQASMNVFCNTAQKAMEKGRRILKKLEGKLEESTLKAPEFAYHKVRTLPGRNSSL